ncbi:MAG: hypothetical protein KUG77_27335, partial [Nannocystaceae bacterium]|nr:hypothetical protein [Nannocystaceae bacterium]
MGEPTLPLLRALVAFVEDKSTRDQRHDSRAAKTDAKADGQVVRPVSVIPVETHPEVDLPAGRVAVGFPATTTFPLSRCEFVPQLRAQLLPLDGQDGRPCDPCERESTCLLYTSDAA